MRKRLPRDDLYDTIKITKEDLDSNEIKEVIMARKKKEVELNHEFQIWQASDGRWKTYWQSPGEKRKLIAFKNKDDLLTRLLELKYNVKDNPTIESLFEDWLCEKLEYNEISEQSASRYRQDFNRFFTKYEWNILPILSIDMDILTAHVKHTIVNEKLTKKTFGNFRILIRGIFLQAKKEKYIDWNVSTLIEDMFISKKSFTINKKNPADEILNDYEADKMITYLNNNKDIMNMAILLDFYTGLRIGELCALKKSDFVNDEYLYIQRTETAIHGQCKEDEELSSTVISDNTKTESGTRMVYLCEEAQEIIRWLINYPRNNTEWMFVSRNQNRIVRATLHRRLTQICDAIEIPHKSMHKIRKTYASRLLDSGVSENIICKQLGHSTIDITKNYYYFTHQMKEEQRRQLSEAVSGYSNQNVRKLKLITNDFRRVSRSG